MTERAAARIDLGALRHNCRSLRSRLGEGTELCAVLKADGYGHGAAACARAVVEGGADRIALAAAREAAELAEAAPGVPLLVLGALTPEESEWAIELGADVCAWHPGFVDALSRRAADAGRRARVHVKYDTGMGRLGDSDPEAVAAMARRVAEDANLELAGAWTHFATADSDPGYLSEQLERFASLGARLRAEHPGICLHAANSAALLREPASHFDMVRPGVAVYGLDPFGREPAEHDLRPALSLHSYVAAVKRFEPGMSAGYGRTWTARETTWLGTVPVGYGDGVRRLLSNRGEVIVAGRRRPIVGTVSMDNITVELGPDPGIEPGEEVVLIGSSGGEQVSAEEVAGWIGTINYEVTCGISPRVPRRLAGGGEGGS